METATAAYHPLTIFLISYEIILTVVFIFQPLLKKSDHSEEVYTQRLRGHKTMPGYTELYCLKNNGHMTKERLRNSFLIIFVVKFSDLLKF